MSSQQIAIIMGSDSDLPIMQAAAAVCELFEIAFELTIVSAHRTPQRLVEYATGAEARGLEVIIAGAGGAAHLPGMVASLTPLPVIGVPIKASSLEGLDSLLSIVQMPGGVPVATVAINGARNAAILAAQILGVKDRQLRHKVAHYKQELLNEVATKIDRLEAEGYSHYLKNMAK
jgi:5-(carboxyamino)imidazole ribonucleotide mutase